MPGIYTDLLQGIVRDTASDDDMLIKTIELKEIEMSHVTMLVKVDVRRDKNDWKETLKINNQTPTVLIDTGANCTVASKKQLEALKLNGKKLNKSFTKQVVYGKGQQVKPLGQKAIKCQNKDKEYDQDFHVIKMDVRAVLGNISRVELGMVKMIIRVEEKPETDFLSEYEDLFPGLACVNRVSHIQVNPGSCTSD